ncbi:uncharacterized protein LOC105420184 [Amborella trichopoda]|uniref:uncharacterized protein LOC105420184 n=1 Tax=Amborella trichopoda TaxID=13333 RepID=UPI0009C015B0|nr:uncharacterized protein LOC105420184 [Amborella trichopoda]|eukprot:XP_020519196.1 uncharacterized protein LOC105420184 [Amborella trichopoda]
MGKSSSNHTVQDRFKHSGETVSRHFERVLNVIYKLSFDYVHLPLSSSPSEIRKKSIYYLFFKNCIGAIDGTHIHVSIGVEEQAPQWNRKGFLLQNVIVACSFELRFEYVLVGWERSSSNSSVLKAVLKSNFKVPRGHDKYYLVDVGYANTQNFIAPFRGNVIERAFGLLNKRFPLLKVATIYPYETQVKIVVVACTLLSHIRTIIDGDDWLCEEYDRDLTRGSLKGTNIQHNDVNPQVDKNDGDELRDLVAKALWDDDCAHY